MINGKDVFSASFFSCDGENSYRMLSFLKLQGFPMNIQLGNVTDDIMKKMKDIPAYSDNECVELDDVVIVKLSS